MDRTGSFNQPQENRSLFALFSDLWRETSTLVHKEAELAKAEMSEKVSQVSTGMAELAIGGLIVFAGFIILLMALSNGLMHLLPEEQADWLAPLIVGAVVVVFGFIAVLRGRSNVRPESLAPERTMESLRRDAQMMKEHAS
jgi:formate hydrogenlyase subunit 3/multisubunit Na+/H+ antiporter MnhD subunit